MKNNGKVKNSLHSLYIKKYIK